MIMGQCLKWYGTRNYEAILYRIPVYADQVEGERHA